MRTKLFKFPEKFLKNKVICGFSNKLHGNLSFKRGHVNEVVENRKKFLNSLGIQLNNVVAMQEVHNDHIYIVKNKDKGRGAFSKTNWVEGVDGLLTKKKDVFLFGTFADCLPIFFFDPERKVVGIAHVGWRGVVLNICKKMLLAMYNTFQCNPQDILTIIGPSIGECCFEVQGDILSEFENSKNYIIKRNNRIFINLQQVCFEQMRECRITKQNIYISNICTSCNNDIYSSYRKDRNKTTGMGGVIGLKK